jgi:mannose/fructose-specific phosphotransferase system component IIA
LNRMLTDLSGSTQWRPISAMSRKSPDCRVIARGC